MLFWVLSASASWNFLKRNKALRLLNLVWARHTTKLSGFSWTKWWESWVDLIVNCITSARFSIFINGEPKGSIIPQKGLRQGCPFSPYLFLFCSEVLSSLIHKAEESQIIHGLKVNLRSPSVSHLLFADDCLLFSEDRKMKARHSNLFFTNTRRHQGKNLILRNPTFGLPWYKSVCG